MLTVLHEDNHLLVIDKPAGLLSQPDASGDEDVIALAKRYLIDRWDKPGDAFAAPVHRLDRPVWGVLVVAKTSKAAARLSKQFQKREVDKRYRAVVHGGPEAESGELRHRLTKTWDAETGATTRVDPEGREAITRYEVVARRGARSLVELEPVTGRPHQLRVQLAAVGCAIVGDTKYGSAEPLGDRSIALRARAITLRHPTLRERMTFEASAPAGWPW